MTLSKENSEGRCDGASWYGEDMVSPDYYLHITPIEKHGREVYGSMEYSVGPKTVCGWYRTYEEFEQKLNDYFALVKENGYDMTPCVNYDLTRQY